MLYNMSKSTGIFGDFCLVIYIFSPKIVEAENCGGITQKYKYDTMFLMKRNILICWDLQVTYLIFSDLILHKRL